MLPVLTALPTFQKRYTFWISVYIISFVAFFLWTATVDKAGSMIGLRHLATGVFVLSFLFLPSPKSIAKPTIPLFVFISYCCLTLLLQGETLLAVMHGLWLMFALVFLPKIICLNFDVFEYYVVKIFQGTLVLLLAITFYSEYFDLDVYFGRSHRLRFTGGLSNPAIYSALVVTSLWLSLLIYVLRSSKIYLLFIPFYFYLLFSSDVRTHTYSVFIGLVAFLFLKSQKSKSYFLVIIFFSCLTLLWAFAKLSLPEIDIATSGRIEKWIALYDESRFDSNLNSILFGTGEFIMHFDNQWFQTLVVYGLVGFILKVFSVAYLLSELNFSKTRSDNLVFRNVFAWASAVLIMMCTMGFTMTIFPTLGNVFNLILLPIVFAISTFCLNKKQDFGKL